MNTLHVFYDSRCGMCRRFKNWLADQRQLVTLEFTSYHLPEAREICPELDEHEPDSELVVMSDTGEIFRGAEAWITCLRALKDYRELAEKLSQPRWFGLARKVCHLVSDHRLTLSKWLFWRSDEEMLTHLEENLDAATDLDVC